MVAVKLKFRPLHDRVLIERINEEVTKGGIVIPDNAKEKPSQGKVLAVGPGKLDANGKIIPLNVKAGDKVIFGKYSGTDITVDGKDLTVMREEDIVGIIE
jgi:chaperonin GroES